MSVSKLQNVEEAFILFFDLAFDALHLRILRAFKEQSSHRYFRVDPCLLQRVDHRSVRRARPFCIDPRAGDDELPLLKLGYVCPIPYRNWHPDSTKRFYHLCSDISVALYQYCLIHFSTPSLELIAATMSVPLRT